MSRFHRLSRWNANRILYDCGLKPYALTSKAVHIGCLCPALAIASDGICPPVVHHNPKYIRPLPFTLAHCKNLVRYFCCSQTRAYPRRDKFSSVHRFHNSSDLALIVIEKEFLQQSLNAYSSFIDYVKCYFSHTLNLKFFSALFPRLFYFGCQRFVSRIFCF